MTSQYYNSKLLNAYQTIEQLRLQSQYQEQQIQQLHQYIERLENGLNYYKSIAKRSQDQIKFLQGEPIQQHPIMLQNQNQKQQLTNPNSHIIIDKNTHTVVRSDTNRQPNRKTNRQTKKENRKDKKQKATTKPKGVSKLKTHHVLDYLQKNN